MSGCEKNGQRQDLPGNGTNPAGLSLDEPTPEFAVEFADTCEALLQQLPGDELKETVLLKLEGLSEAEIAERVGCSTRTVQRRLEIARRCWDKRESTGTLSILRSVPWLPALQRHRSHESLCLTFR